MCYSKATCLTDAPAYGSNRNHEIKRVREERRGRKIQTCPWLGLALVLVFLVVPMPAIAGGIKIFPESVVFDNDKGKREFQPNTTITVNFKYEEFGYAGKPHKYMVFELHRVGKNEKDPRPRLFVIPLINEYGYADAKFRLPEHGSVYLLSYHVVPFFSHRPLKKSWDKGEFITADEEREIRAFYKANYAGTEKIEELRSSSRPADPKILTIYFKNGLKKEIDAAIAARKPPTFSWYKGTDSSPGVKDVEFSYRMDPLEEWSDFSTATQATYYLLTPGNYVFELRGRYIMDGQRKETAVASLPVKVKEVVSAPPPAATLPKGEGITPEFWEKNRYPESKALLVGVTKYDDHAFLPLPYVAKDIELMAGALTAQGFSVERLETGTTKARIVSRLSGFLDNATRGDRIVVYFSGHGTSLGASNFLVSTDCETARRNVTCIGYDWLKGQIDEAMVQKGVKHLLVILDACQAGLGLYSKSVTGTPLESLAKYPGAHMMTAGLMEQNANIDTQDGASVFTLQLVEGLNGKADLTGDNVITLSELLVFTQESVSRIVYEKFNETQVPVMGKIKGAGEMLFRIPEGEPR